jgi:gas vesicle protein
MSEQEQREGGQRFAIGFLAGACVGVGVALWMAPRLTAESRQRMRDSARSFVREAAERYQQTNARLSEAVDELTLNTREVRANLAGAVARGARKVEQVATAVKENAAAETIPPAPGSPTQMGPS